jgi:pyruvate dehydrogenase E2 component (dihydrolipoamide acetyltransferase)
VKLTIRPASTETFEAIGRWRYNPPYDPYDSSTWKNAGRFSPAVAYEFKLPDLGEGLTEGEIARWLVQEGQEISEDDPLVEVQTDKTTVEIPSPAGGKVSRILVEEGQVVAVGTVLVVIGEDGAAPAAEEEQPRAEPAPQQQAAPDATRIRATPLVRKVAQELGVDLGTLEGTGPQGRITEEDVRRAVTAGDDVRRVVTSEGQAPGRGQEGRREPLRGVRRLIAEHMARANREVAPVTWVEECDFGAVDLKLIVPTVLKAAAETLKDVPELNARLEGDDIVYLDRYDLGFAVQTDQGLVVPVVRACDSRSIDELDAEVRRLADAAREGHLKPEELRGSTFTVTSAGKLAGLFQTPIVNHPEVGILSIGRVAERPVVRVGKIVARPVGYVALTFDHRVVDGARAAEFGLAVIRRLEQPAAG